MISICSSPQHLGGGHGYMANAVSRAYNVGLGAEPPAGSRGKKGLRGQWAKSPLKLEHFCFLDVNESRKFAHFSTIWKRKDTRYMCYLCKKITCDHETGGKELQQNWKACVPLGPGLKPPLLIIRTYWCILSQRLEVITQHTRRNRRLWCQQPAR